jgi:cytochrome c-type biogenesis protein CcmH/NrfG
VERQPEDAGAWRRLTRVAVALADLEGAVRASRRALALDPRSPEARRLATEMEALRTPAGASATATATPSTPRPARRPSRPPIGSRPSPQPDIDG